MSFYVVCKLNKEGDIQGFLETRLNPKLVFELVLVELQYSSSWHTVIGSIGLDINGKKISNAIEEYDYSSVEILQVGLDSILKHHKYKNKILPSIKYDNSKKLLQFDSGNPQIKFFVDDILKNTFNLYHEVFSNARVHFPSRIEKTRIFNVYCDLIQDQLVGSDKTKL